jgi:hypothetical protein
MMEQRKPFALNGRKFAVKEFRAAAILYPKSGERQSVFAYARTGRQNSEGFGGGRVVGK